MRLAKGLTISTRFCSSRKADPSKLPPIWRNARVSGHFFTQSRQWQAEDVPSQYQGNRQTALLSQEPRERLGSIALRRIDPLPVAHPVAVYSRVQGGRRSISGILLTLLMLRVG